MSVTALASQHQAELHRSLWDMANSLRGQMEASEFKNYILGIIFYRYLSENVEQIADEFLVDDGLTYFQGWEQMSDELAEALVDHAGYVIQPQYLFSEMIERIKQGDDGGFDVEYLSQALTALIDSTRGEDSQEDFAHLFDDLDLTSSKLGRNNADRSRLMARILSAVNDISFNFADTESDVLGDAYEYMISNFAASAGKKAGEFYTPQQVSKILSKIVADGKQRLRSVYDPTCGSGSLLLRVARETKKGEVGTFYGQELTSTTYNLARMNMMLHGVRHQDFDIKNANTLTEPQHLGKKFEAIVANPPYSAHWSADAAFLNDERFSEYGRLAPKTKADFAFVQHMLYHLDENGTMAVVLPHGVLFRGAAEGVIREHIVKEKNYLDAVIGLPADIFYGTGIPTVVLVFKKCREPEDDVLFIDASGLYEKGKNQNVLTDEHVDKIISTYQNREEVERFSHKASLEEIEENDYNLNIPRYVDTSEPEELVDLDAVAADLARIEEEAKVLDEQLDGYFAELGLVRGEVK